MFYVSRERGAIYSSTFDKDRGFYPQVEFSKRADGLVITKLDTGVSCKPADRQHCTLEEVYAQLGLGNQPEPVQYKPVKRYTRQKTTAVKPVLADETNNEED